MRLDPVAELAEEINDLTSDQMWELAKYMIDRYPVQANLMRADLEFAEQDLHFKD